MAITFVAASAVVTGANPTVAIPTGYAKDDLLLIVTTGTATPTTPAGWTQLASQGANQFITVLYKYAAATEASVAVTLAGTTSKSVMTAYRGAGAFQASATFLTGTNIAPSTNTTTTTYANDFVLSIYANPSGAARTWTPNASTTSRVNSATTSTINGLLIASELQVAAGATTARTAAISLSSAWSGLQIAFIETRTVYWVGGNGTWSSPGIAGTTGANWADTSGGTGGVIVPMRNDAVIVDGSSGSPTITLSAIPACASLTTTGATCTLSSTGTLQLNGSMTLSATTTWSATGIMSIIGTGTVTTNAVSIASPITIDGVSQTVTLGSALTTTSALVLNTGTLVLNGFDANCLTHNSNGPGVRGITFGSNYINITSTATGTVLDQGTSTSFTPSGAGGFKLTGAAASGITRTISMGVTGGSVATSPNVFVAAGAAGSIISIVTTSWVGDLNFTGFSGTFSPAASSATTIAGSLTLAAGMTFSPGSSSTITFVATSTGKTITSAGKSLNTIVFNGVGGGWTLQDTMTAVDTITLTNGTLTLNGFDANCLTFSGSGTTARGIAFGSNYVNITSVTTVSVLVLSNATLFTPTGTGGFKLTGAAASGITRTVVAGTTGGALATAPNVLVSAGAAGSIVAITTGSVLDDLIFTGFSGTFAPPTALTLYGSLTAASGMTWTTGTGGIIFAATSTGNTIDSAGKSLYNVSFSGAGGGWSLTSGLTLVNVFTLTNGTVNANNFNVSALSYTLAGGAATMGSGTWTASGTGTVWNCTGTTITANTSTIALSTTTSTAITFAGAGQTYNNLSLTGAAGTGTLTITNANTFNTLSSSRTGNYTITLPGSNVTTTVATWSIAGTNGVTNQVTINSSSTGVPAILSVASGTVNPGYAYIQDSTATGGATFVSTSAVNGGNNTGWGFTSAANTLYWVGGTGTWDTTTATNWSNNSGGTGGVAVPTALLNAAFDGSSGSGTITLSGAIVAKSIDTTGSSFTFSSNGTPTISGGFTLSSTTVWSASGNITFNGIGAITTNGVTLTNASIIINGVGTTTTLGSDLILGTARTITLTQGTFSLNGFDATCYTFSSNNSNTRTLTFDTNNINITFTGGSATVVDIATGTGLSVTTATGGFKLTNGTTAGTRTVNVGATAPTTTGQPNVWFSNGTDTVTVTSGSVIGALDFTGFSGTFTMVATLSVFGSLTYNSSMTLGSAAGTMQLTGTGSATITTAGKIITHNITKSSSGTLTLQDALVMGTAPNSYLALTLNAGSLVLNGFDIICASFTSATSSVRNINFGSNYISIRSTTAATNLNITVLTTFTFTGAGGFKLDGGFSGNTNTITIGSTGASTTTTPNVTLVGVPNNIAITSGSAFKNLDFGTYSQTIAPPASLNIYGSLTLSSASTWTTGTGTISFLGTDVGNTLNTNGKTLYNVTVNNGVGSLLLSGNLLLSNTFTLTAGTFNANNFNVGALNYTLTAGNLIMGSGIWNANGTGAVWTRTTSTITPNTSDIVITDVSATAKTFAGGGATYYDLQIGNGAGAATYTFTGANTFNTISSSKTAAYTVTLPASTTTTVANWTATGISGNVLTLNSSTAGTQATLALSGGGIASGADYVTIQDINFTPLPTGTQKYVWYMGNNSTFGTNVTGGALITSDTTKIAYRLLTGTSWTVPSDWNSSSNSIYLLGGGGGGSGAVVNNAGGNHASGGGGGGGGFTLATNVSLTPSASVAYAIGAAGTAGIGSTTASTAGPGGATTFNSGAYTTTGGGGAASSVRGNAGTGATNNGGAGGNGVSTANASRSGGGGGGAGGESAVGGTGVTGGASAGGAGGDGDGGIKQYIGIAAVPYGDGGTGANAAVLPGSVGTLYGSGGSGAGCLINSSGTAAGGAGTQGAIIIIYTLGSAVNSDFFLFIA